MNTYIALFRGVNVGGKNRLPMKELASILENLGAREVKTYIQSGNAVFRSEAKDAASLASEITAAIHEAHGFEPHVLLLQKAELERAIAANPFPQAEAEPKSLHLFFLAARPTAPDLDALADLQRDSERFELIDTVFYLHAPEGVGRSKLAARAEKALGVPLTARNWRTVEEIWEMAKQCGG